MIGFECSITTIRWFRDDCVEFSSDCLTKPFRFVDEVIDCCLVWDSNRLIISATRDDVFVRVDGRGGTGGGGDDDVSTNETNDCEGRMVNVNALVSFDDW